MSDIEVMVAGNKQTTYMGKVAWTVPNGKVTTDFSFACSCWSHFLSGNTDWLWSAMTRKPL